MEIVCNTIWKGLLLSCLFKVSIRQRRVSFNTEVVFSQILFSKFFSKAESEKNNLIFVETDVMENQN